MTQVNAAMLAAHRFTLALIPEAVKKWLSAEILDRCVEAERLSTVAARATDPVERQGYSSIAKAILAAKPATRRKLRRGR